MIFSLGFLVAALGALAIAPAFWHRAIRLVTRKLELQLPASAREVLAGRDLLRAELAVEQRKLEQKVESLGALRARDMAELGRHMVAVAGKDAELDVLQQRLTARDEENADLRRYLAEATDALDATTAALHDANARWDRSEADLHEVRHELEATRKRCADQAEVLAELERKLVHEHDARGLETAGKVRPTDEISGLWSGHDAALARLKAASSDIFGEGPGRLVAEGTEAESRAEPRERSESPLAADPSFRRDIDRLAADLLAYDVDAEALEGRPASGHAPADARAVLRKRISEIGERAIRLAGAGRSAGPRQETSNAPARMEATEPRG